MKRIISILMVLVTMLGVLSFNVSASEDDVTVYLNEKESSRIKVKLISGEPYICIEDAFKYCSFKTSYHNSYYGYHVDVENRELHNDYETTLLRFCFDSYDEKSYTEYTEKGRNVFRLKTTHNEAAHNYLMVEQDEETHYVHYTDLYRILELEVINAPEINSVALYLNSKAPGKVTLYNRRGQPVDICPLFKEKYIEIGYSKSADNILVLPKAKAVPADGIKVSLNGALLEFDVMPTTINGRTMVPLRAIFEALSATVEWREATQTVVSTRGKTTIKLTIDSNVMFVNDNRIILDTPAKEIGGRTLVPVRAVSEAFGIKVDWDENNFMVILREDKYADVKTQILYNSSNQIIEVPDFEVDTYINDGWFINQSR